MAVPSLLGAEQNRDRVVSMLREASSEEPGRIGLRVRCSHLWASCARRWNHPSVLEAYRTSIQVLHMAVTIVSLMEMKHTRLTSEHSFHDSKNLASDAAALALDQQQLGVAVELLEQGRGIMFSQLGQLRTPLEDLPVAQAEMAIKFGRLSSQLDTFAVSPYEEDGGDHVGRYVVIFGYDESDSDPKRICFLLRKYSVTSDSRKNGMT